MTSPHTAWSLLARLLTASPAPLQWLQRRAERTPVKVLLGTVDDGYGNISYLREGDALPVDSVRQSGGYILIKGD